MIYSQYILSVSVSLPLWISSVSRRSGARVRFPGAPAVSRPLTQSLSLFPFLFISTSLSLSLSHFIRLVHLNSVRRQRTVYIYTCVHVECAGGGGEAEAPLRRARVIVITVFGETGGPVRGALRTEDIVILYVRPRRVLCPTLPATRKKKNRKKIGLRKVENKSFMILLSRTPRY